MDLAGLDTEYLPRERLMQLRRQAGAIDGEGGDRLRLCNLVKKNLLNHVEVFRSVAKFAAVVGEYDQEKLDEIKGAVSASSTSRVRARACFDLGSSSQRMLDNEQRPKLRLGSATA